MIVQNQEKNVKERLFLPNEGFLSQLDVPRCRRRILIEAHCGRNFLILSIKTSSHFEYRKVANTNMSLLEAHPCIYRLLMYCDVLAKVDFPILNSIILANLWYHIVPSINACLVLTFLQKVTVYKYQISNYPLCNL